MNLGATRRWRSRPETNRWKEGLDVVVEGPAVKVTDDDRLRTLADLWREKYDGDWDFSVADGMFHHDDGGNALVFKVAPTKVLAFAKGQLPRPAIAFRRRRGVS